MWRQRVEVMTTHSESSSSRCPGWSCHPTLVHLSEIGEWVRTLLVYYTILPSFSAPSPTLFILTQPAYECFCHQSHVPQVPHIRIKVIEHSPVGPTHDATVELCYVLAQGQEPGGPTSPLINLRAYIRKT